MKKNTHATELRRRIHDQAYAATYSYATICKEARIAPDEDPLGPLASTCNETRAELRGGDGERRRRTQPSTAGSKLGYRELALKALIHHVCCVQVIFHGASHIRCLKRQPRSLPETGNFQFEFEASVSASWHKETPLKKPTNTVKCLDAPVPIRRERSTTSRAFWQTNCSWPCRKSAW